MENIYFKGLEKALNDNCYIKVFSCSSRYPVVRVEKKNKETKQEELVSYAEKGNVISALNSASCKIIDELADNKDNRVWCENTLIDRVVRQGYTLHFFKLSNGQVLSTICGGGYGQYIPVKSIISDDIQTGFETLNATLQGFDFDYSYDWDEFVDKQTEPVQNYRNSLKSNQK